MSRDPRFMLDPDPLIHQPSRLRIIAVLAAIPQGEGSDFMSLRALTSLTDGNLSSHLSTLEESGYISLDKEFVGKKPKTRVWITSKGRRAFAAYIEALEGILMGQGTESAQS